MTTLYTFDDAGYYTGPHTITDPYAPQPAGTPAEPPDAPDGHVPLWTGSAWVVVPVPVPVTPAPAVPQLVTAFQAKAALLQASLLDDVEALIAHEDTPRIIKLAWAETLHFERSSPTVAAIASALSLDDAYVDALFVTAGQITA